MEVFLKLGPSPCIAFLEFKKLTKPLNPGHILLLLPFSELVFGQYYVLQTPLCIYSTSYALSEHQHTMKNGLYN